MTVTVAEAQARLPELLAALQPGDQLTLTQDGRSVADVVAKLPPPGTPRGPDLRMRAALAAAVAAAPKKPCLINDQDLRDARAGEMYGDPA